MNNLTDNLREEVRLSRYQPPWQQQKSLNYKIDTSTVDNVR